MSVLIPYHRMISPASSRTGSNRATTQRNAPSWRRRRPSNSPPWPDATISPTGRSTSEDLGVNSRLPPLPARLVGRDPREVLPALIHKLVRTIGQFAPGDGRDGVENRSMPLSGRGVCVLSPKSVRRCHRRLERRRPGAEYPSIGSSRVRPPSPRGSLPDECIALPLVSIRSMGDSGARPRPLQPVYPIGPRRAVPPARADHFHVAPRLPGPGPLAPRVEVRYGGHRPAREALRARARGRAMTKSALRRGL